MSSTPITPTLSSLSPTTKDLCAGTMAGMANILLCHPLDTIRVRMQTTNHSKFININDLIKKTYRNEGIYIYLNTIRSH